MTRYLNRRQALMLGGSVVAGAVIADDSQHWFGDSPRVPRFETSLPIPPVQQPVRTDATTDYYEITQREARREILAGRQTTIWGYEGMFPGPTIRARRGRTAVVRQANQLPFPTVVHLHGGATPPESDGFPTDFIMPGEAKTYVYPNDQPAATLWYHDHAMDHTGRNLYMGLAGFYLLSDDEEASLRLPTGACDVPLLIQTRAFRRDGSLAYDAFEQLGARGDVVMVNGAPWPRLEVARRRYRFRILNGSNATIYDLALGSGHPLIQIATDGGLLPAPTPVPSIPLAMAERVEVVVDFSAYPLGTQVLLRNLADDGARGEILRFDVMRDEQDDSELPRRLTDAPSIPPELSTHTRELTFFGRPSFPPLRAYWTINGKDFDALHAIAEPRYGDVEIWHLINRRLGFLGLPHPVHIHLVRFQILERNGKPPLFHERGWKDTVAVGKGENVRVIMRFEGHRGRYLVHCHNLEHEDHSMMARYDVV
jgi:FtsP/CotA-like multicopper oxidase with cupredoxin domain